MEVIVEQLGTTNNVLERHKFDQRRVWLARAFSNDVILTDEHVDAVHACLEFDDEGRLFIVDQGTVNGIRRPRHKARLEREEVASGDVFLVGRSRLRIFTGIHPVPPAVRIRVSEVFLLWLGKPQVSAALVLLFVLARLLETWLTTIGEFRWSLVIERHLGDSLAFLGLAVGVYFLSVLFRRGGNFLAHISLLILIFLVAAIVEVAHSVLVFNAGDPGYPALDVLAAAGGSVELFVYLWSILYLAFHIPLLKRTLISLGIVAITVGLNHLPEDEITRFINQQQSMPLKQTFHPPALLFAEPQSEAAFLEAGDALFEAVDEARAEALERRREVEQARATGDEDAESPADPDAEPDTDPDPDPDPDQGPDPGSGSAPDQGAGQSARARARHAPSSSPSAASSGLRRIAACR